jgi:hypothetical protein
VEIAENSVTLQLDAADCFVLASGLSYAGLREADGQPAGVAQTAAAGLLEGAGMAAASWLHLVGEGRLEDSTLAHLRGRSREREGGQS